MADVLPLLPTMSKFGILYLLANGILTYDVVAKLAYYPTQHVLQHIYINGISSES